MNTPLVLKSWPRAILHIDADAFFVSVEQALHPELRGKPVITGAERGIVTAASYEAKALGVKRGVSLTEAVHLCPDLVMVQSDYTSYSLFSERMFAILRRFTPDVETYSIDEAFADLTGLRRMYREGYQAIAKNIQHAIHQELDITVSVGVSLSKSLAKLCSKMRKPHGFVAAPGNTIHLLLAHTPLAQVWGFGPNTVALLQKLGCTTALDFVRRPRYFAEEHLGRTGVEIWSELRGELVYRIDPTPKTTYASISKTHTFTPPSSDPDYVFAQALRNLEAACAKARRHRLHATSLALSLREQTFRLHGLTVPLPRPTHAPLDLTTTLRALFAPLYRAGHTYRATGVVLAGLQPDTPAQMHLFEDPARAAKTAAAGHASDTLNARFGRRTLFLSDGLQLRTNTAASATLRGGPASGGRSLTLPQWGPRMH